MTSCYFSDSSNAVTFSTISSPVVNNNARKVIQYTYVPNYGDSTDDVSGHGTHTCGTLVGAIAGADYTTSKHSFHTTTTRLPQFCPILHNFAQFCPILPHPAQFLFLAFPPPITHIHPPLSLPHPITPLTPHPFPVTLSSLQPSLRYL